jgi:hypothetical protein
MNNRTLLLIDAVINLALGVLPGAFPAKLVELIGIPPSSERSRIRRGTGAFLF